MMDVPTLVFSFFLFFSSSFVIQPFSGEHHPQTDFNLILATLFVQEIKTVARRHRTVATPFPPTPQKEKFERNLATVVWGEKREREREVSPNFGISFAFCDFFSSPKLRLQNPNQ
jgi:hypothetical protein